MKVSELIAKLDEFRMKHGDVDIDAPYWCDDCNDEHQGDGLLLLLTDDGHLEFEILRIGEGGLNDR